MAEVWADISKEYQVSNMGNIRSLWMWDGNKYRARSCPKIMKKQLATTGYEKVTLKIDGKRKDFKVHRLVALAFIPQIDGKPHVNHKDGDKTNNVVENLEWCNRSENMLHAYRLGLKLPRKSKKVKIPKPPRKKYNVPKEELKADILSGMRNVDIARKYGCTRQLVAVRKYQMKKGEY